MTGVIQKTDMYLVRFWRLGDESSAMHVNQETGGERSGLLLARLIHVTLGRGEEGTSRELFTV